MNLCLITYRAEDGLELDGAWYTREDSPCTAAPLVVMTHGAWMNFYTGPQRFLPQFITPAGFDCLAINSRDRDLGYIHPPDGTCYGMLRCRFDDVLLDLSGALAWGRDRGYHSFILVCHSYSGQRGAFFLSRRGSEGIEGIAMMSPPAGMGENHRFWVDDWEGFTGEAERLVKEGVPHKILVERPSGRFPIIARAATVADLWVENNPIEACGYMVGLKVPLLHTLGEKETLLAPISSKGKWIAGAWGGPVTRAVVPGCGHFYRENPDGLGEVVSKWVCGLMA